MILKSHRIDNVYRIKAEALMVYSKASTLTLTFDKTILETIALRNNWNCHIGHTDRQSKL